MLKKLCFVVNVDSFFVSHRLSLAKEALNNGYEVHIVTKVTSYAEQINAHGFILHEISLTRSSIGILSNGLTFLHLWSILKKIEPDILHLVTIKPVIMGGLLARITGIPCVVMAISGLGYVFISKGLKARLIFIFLKWLYRAALDHPNIKVIFQNQDDCKTIINISGINKKNVTVINGSGVDLSKYTPTKVSVDRPIVMMASRLLIDKGVRDFVDASRKVDRGYTKTRFVLVGEPDPENPSSIFEQEIEKWVAEGIIEWWGYRDDMHSVITRSYMVVLPSYREGLPKILSEAAACGRAVVTTDVPGCRDSIVPNRTGILVPTRDPDSLAKAIETLLNDPALCQMMGVEGRKLAEKYFDEKAIVDKQLLIYEELLTSHRVHFEKLK